MGGMCPKESIQIGSKPQGTPNAKNIALEAKALAEVAGEEEKGKQRTSADAARLIFIMFSDEVYLDLP